jgi:hypothetical protein
LKSPANCHFLNNANPSLAQKRTRPDMLAANNIDGSMPSSPAKLTVGAAHSSLTMTSASADAALHTRNAQANAVLSLRILRSMHSRKVETLLLEA